MRRPTCLGYRSTHGDFFELFLCSRLGARRSTDTEWRDILRLCAYKWFVPCYVNAVSLPTLLVYWDTLFLRRPPTGQEGLSAAHLMLALALVSATLDETRDEMADSRPEECLAHGFNRLLSGALAQVDAEALVATAARFEVSTRQLAYLRVHLAGPAVHGEATCRQWRGQRRHGHGRTAAASVRAESECAARRCILAHETAQAAPAARPEAHATAATAATPASDAGHSYTPWPSTVPCLGLHVCDLLHGVLLGMDSVPTSCETARRHQGRCRPTTASDEIMEAA